MIHLFNPENKFWNFIGKVADVFCMSILWLVTSVPILTIGAATTAFYSFTMRQVRDQEGGIFFGYFDAFKKYFKKATILWLIELAGLAFFAVDLIGVWNFCRIVGGAPGVVAASLIVCLLAIFLACTLYLYPTLAVFDFPVKKLLTNSFIMAVGNLPVTITLFLLWALAAVAFYYISGLFFFWIGLVIFLSSYFITVVFKKYTGELAEEEAEHARQKRERQQRRKMRGL